MIPNSWLYKLRDMGSRRKKKASSSPQHSSSSQTKDPHCFPSQHFDKQVLTNPYFPHPPKEHGRKAIYRPSPKSASSDDIEASHFGQCKCNNRADIRKKNMLSSVCKGELPHIITKRETFDDKRTPTINKIRAKQDDDTSRTKKKRAMRKPMSSSTGIRLRSNSPRVANTKRRRNSPSSRNDAVGESFVVVMTSTDALRDFRESMVEMIVVNNIRKSKDLEDLLACYLSLNSNEYHGIIVKAFEQVWLNLALLCSGIS